MQLYIMVALSISSVCTEAVDAFTQIQLRSMPPRRSSAAALLEVRNAEDALQGGRGRRKWRRGREGRKRRGEPDG